MFFLVRSVRGLVICAYAFSVLYMKWALNWQASRKHLISSEFSGGPASLIAWTFLESADVADLEKIVPNHDTDVGPKVYFSLLRVRPL